MISIIIPAFNEEKRLLSTLYEIFNYLKLEQIKAEVIIVNDGSTDNTSLIIENVFEEFDNLKLINLEKNYGKGFAVKTGVLSASGEIVIFLDADNSTSLSHIKEVVTLIGDGYEVVIGSRDTKGSNVVEKQPLVRLGIGKIFSLFTKNIGLSTYNDTQCGFKGFKSESAKDIFSRTTIRGFAFDIEVLCIAQKYEFRIKELPVKWKNNIESKVRIKNIWDMFWDVWKIKTNLKTGVYDKQENIL
ncbi:MAG: dolichyl-phosphate beta-glucosyltransferase [Candidatus Paceibacterota bacterium]|jgi:dolichyl-phosphate beta-glucosyltransferase|nr:glycosyltransferase family 2 protein [bacterium]